MYLTVTFAWVIYEIVVLVWTEFLSRTLKIWEKVLLVVLGIAVAVYGGYSEHQDSVLMASLREGQSYNTGQLDTITKILGPKLGNTSNDAQAMAKAASEKIDQLSQQVADLQAHTEVPVIPPDTEANIVNDLKNAGPHSVEVMVLAGNRNANVYGHQWVKIFEAANWMPPASEPGSFVPFGGPPAVGLSFQVKGPTIPEGLKILGQILAKNHIPFNPTATKGNVSDENSFVLMVGENP
jgi:hypothetical protein